MKRLIAVMTVALACLGVCAEDTYTLGLRVGNGQVSASTSKSAGNQPSLIRDTQVKTTTSTKTWPVTVSCQGKARPSSLKLKVYYIGTNEGEPAVLRQDEVPVELDAKGVFKANLESPAAKMVKTVTKSRIGRGGSMKSETVGDRITGCIVQLMDGEKVAKSYASNPSWAQFAKKNPLPEADVLKFR